MSVIRILGIDPGSINTGWGILDFQGNHLTHVDNGIIKIKGDDIAAKLKCIYTGLQSIIDEYQPDEFSIEKVFMHKNADSALKLGQARGAAITAGTMKDKPVYEYSATQVKQATVGKGHAAKEQVQHMVKVLLCLREVPATDAADALAIAICHAHSREGVMRMQGTTGYSKGRMR